MNTERYDVYRRAAEQSTGPEGQIMAQLANAEATLLVAEQLEQQVKLQTEILRLNPALAGEQQ